MALFSAFPLLPSPALSTFSPLPRRSRTSISLRSSPSPPPPPDPSSAVVPMFLTPDGSYSSTKTLTPAEDHRRNPDDKVVVLWDLDNKPPRGPPFDAATSLRRLASLFGTVLHISAYANRHAFVHIPEWVLQDRRDRRYRDTLERSSPPPDLYRCPVCGRKLNTHFALRKHFRTLHQREHEKKLARMRSLKGKRRLRYRERFISGNSKYLDAARELLPNPSSGYGLGSELRRAGVFVKTVADKPQAADAALKQQIKHSMKCGVDWMFLVSDDSDFVELVKRAREEEVRTVVVGDWRTSSLGRSADIWVPWARVERGEIGEDVIRGGGVCRGGEELMTGSELDAAIDEIVVGTRRSGGVGAMHSEDEDEEGSVRRLKDDDFRIYGMGVPGDELFWDSEDDYEDEDDDGF